MNNQFTRKRKLLFHTILVFIYNSSGTFTKLHSSGAHIISRNWYICSLRFDIWRAFHFYFQLFVAISFVKPYPCSTSFWFGFSLPFVSVCDVQNLIETFSSLGEITNRLFSFENRQSPLNII